MRRMTVAACLVSLGLVGAAPAPTSPDARKRIAAGLAAIKAGDCVTAAREFADPAWAGSPLEDYARLFQAESVARQGDLVAARALAAQAADPTPESRLTPSALMRAAAVLREAGDAAAAVTVLQRVVTRLADAPDAPRARYALGEALLAAGDQKEAARVFAALATGAGLVGEQQKSNDARAALRLKADLRETAARPAEAEKTYVKLAADYPDEDEGASALWRLGWIAWFRGNHGEATARWTRLQVVRGGQSLRDAATYWLRRGWGGRGGRGPARPPRRPPPPCPT